MKVPIGLIAIVTSLLVVPELRRDRDCTSIDLAGVLLSATAIGCLILAIIEGNSWGWGSPAIIGLLVGTALLGSLFVWWEARVDHPMLDLHLAALPLAFSLGRRLGDELPER